MVYTQGCGLRAERPVCPTVAQKCHLKATDKSPQAPAWSDVDLISRILPLPAGHYANRPLKTNAPTCWNELCLHVTQCPAQPTLPLM